MTVARQAIGALAKHHSLDQRLSSSPRMNPQSSRLRGAGWFFGFAVGLLVGSKAFADSTPQPFPSSAPYLRLRETTLGYHGPEDNPTNLTESRVGWFGPTNLNDSLTGDLWWAASFAIDQANNPIAAAGGTSPALPFRLIPRWAVDPWGAGVSQLARMVYDDQPAVLIGSVDSATTHLAEQVVAKANLPLISPIATDKSITLAGVSWMFSCAPSDRAIARALVERIVSDKSLADSSGASKRLSLALINSTDHESRMTAREMLREFSSREALPAVRLEISPGAMDLAEPIAAMQAARPAAVLIVAGPEAAARLVSAVRERLKCVIFGSQAMGRPRFLELAGSNAEEVRFPLLFVPDPTRMDSSRFVERFSAARGRAPDYAAALTYDATCLVIAAIQRAGPRRARIREALTQLSPWPGIAGDIQFDGTGQNSRADIRIGIIRNGVAIPWTNLPSN